MEKIQQTPVPSVKRTLTKALILEKCFNTYKSTEGDKSENAVKKRKEVFAKFKTVWGERMAEHFLSKYSDADSLIWAFDAENLELFINKF